MDITPENIDEIVNQIAVLLGYEDFEYSFLWESKTLTITEI